MSFRAGRKRTVDKVSQRVRSRDCIYQSCRVYIPRELHVARLSVVCFIYKSRLLAIEHLWHLCLGTPRIAACSVDRGIGVRPGLMRDNPEHCLGPFWGALLLCDGEPKGRLVGDCGGYRPLGPATSFLLSKWGDVLQPP